MSRAISAGRTTGDGGAPRVERFQATSGRITGWVTVVVAVAIAAAGVGDLREGFHPAVVAAAVLVGALAWASMLRPALWVRDDEVLVMRNMFETVELRLAAVEELALRQFLAVRAGDRRWVSPVVGRSWRRSMTGGRSSSSGGGAVVPDMAYPDFVEDRLRALVEDARVAVGVQPGSAEQLALPDAVRRQPAWPEIALVLGSLLALVAALAF